MTSIRSTWTLSSPPPLTGLLSASEWSGAAQMAIPHGTLLAQNDATHLYVGLDITAETGTANTNDYFWFVVDINNNGVIDPYRDKLFSILPGNLNRLYMFYMLGPDENTGASTTQVIPSLLQSGFGPSLLLAANHRQWQISFALSDLGIAIDPSSPAPVVSFGLRIATSGGFIGELPTNPLGDFSDLNSIVLSTLPAIVLPPTSLGPVIAAVGLVGTGDIAADGYCTITPPYYLNPNEAAFCGTLNLIGNVATLNSLWSAGVAKYQVLHRYGPTVAAVGTAPWSPILQAWANFEIVGSIDVWQSFSPDSSGYYTFINPALPYTIQNLIFQWTTAAEPDGVHQFLLNFFTSANVLVSTTAQIFNPRARQPGSCRQIDQRPPCRHCRFALRYRHSGVCHRRSSIAVRSLRSRGRSLQPRSHGIVRSRRYLQPSTATTTAPTPHPRTSGKESPATPGQPLPPSGFLPTPAPTCSRSQPGRAPRTATATRSSTARTFRR